MSSGNDDSIPDSNSEPIEATAIGAGKSSAAAAVPQPMLASQDTEHLRLLSIFHYVVAALTGFISLFPLLHVAIGVAILTGQLEPTGEKEGPPPAFLGWMFVIIPALMILCGLALAAAIAIAGRKLRRQTGYLYCLVVAAIECLFVPVGTVLGVFTIIVLMRPTVKERFGVTSTTP